MLCLAFKREITKNESRLFVREVTKVLQVQNKINVLFFLHKITFVGGLENMSLPPKATVY